MLGDFSLGDLKSYNNNQFNSIFNEFEPLLNRCESISHSTNEVFKKTKDGAVLKIEIPGFEKNEIKIVVNAKHEIKVSAEHDDDLFGKKSFNQTYKINDNLKPIEFTLVNGELRMFFANIEKEDEIEFKVN